MPNLQKKDTMSWSAVNENLLSKMDRTASVSGDSDIISVEDVSESDKNVADVEQEIPEKGFVSFPFTKKISKFSWGVLFAY